MSIALDPTSENSAKIEVGGQTRMQFTEDGGAELHQSPTQDSPPKQIATMEALWAYGGMPRFTPYVWGGRADAMPAGDTQSSGQQLLDLMYPDMRADVVSTQFTCPENEWQADPYKRVTHWSLGDGVSWMRPPDKNGVQPGNVGAFYGVGSNPAGGVTGSALIDAMRDVRGTFYVNLNDADSAASSGAFRLKAANAGTSAHGSGAERADLLEFRSSYGLPQGTTTDPITGEFRPRTWYGIWMIRMYGRVLNTGTLDAAGLNARMDMLDVRVSALESGSSSPTKNGYKIHADGLIEQWGVLEGVALNSTFHTVTFPITFTQEVFNISGTIAMTGVVDGAISALVKKGGMTLATMQICGDHVSSTGTGDIYWKATGK